MWRINLSIGHGKNILLAVIIPWVWVFFSIHTATAAPTVDVSASPSEILTGQDATFSWVGTAPLYDRGKCYDTVKECQTKRERVPTCSGYSNCWSYQESYVGQCDGERSYDCLKKESYWGKCSKEKTCYKDVTHYGQYCWQDTCQGTKISLCWWGWFPYPCTKTYTYPCQKCGQTSWTGKEPYSCPEQYDCLKTNDYWGKCTETYTYNCFKTRAVYEREYESCSDVQKEVGVKKGYSVSDKVSITGPGGQMYSDSAGRSQEFCYSYSDYCVWLWCNYPSTTSLESLSVKKALDNPGMHTANVQVMDNYNGNSAFGSASVNVKTPTFAVYAYTNEQYVSISTNTGQSCHTGSLRSCKFDLTQGTYTFTATKPGFLDKTQTIDIPGSLEADFLMVKEMSISLSSPNPSTIQQGECAQATAYISDLQDKTDIILNAYSGTRSYWTHITQAQQQNSFQFCIPATAPPGAYTISAQAKSPNQLVGVEKPFAVSKLPMSSALSLQEVKYKSCSMEQYGLACQEQSAGLPTKVWGNSRLLLKYALNNIGDCSQKGCKYDIYITTRIGDHEFRIDRQNGHGTSLEYIQTIDLPAGLKATKIQGEVKNLKSGETQELDIPVQIVPDKDPEIESVSLCGVMPEDGFCQYPIKLNERSNYPFAADTVSDAIPPGKTIALYYKANNLYKYGKSYGLANMKLTLEQSGLNSQGKALEATKIIDTSQDPQPKTQELLESPPVIWVFDVGQAGEKELEIKLTKFISDSKTQESGKKIKLKIHEDTSWMVPGPFQFREGRITDNEKSSDWGDLQQAQKELLKAINSGALSTEEQQASQSALASVSILTPFMFGQSNTVIGGSEATTPSWLGAIGNGIGGFASAVGDFAAHLPQNIGNLVNSGIEAIKQSPGVVRKGIDNLLADPIGNISNAFKGIGQAVSGTANWAFQNPWQALAIVGLAALALTGVGIAASAAGAGGLAGSLGAASSFLIDADIIATAGILGYKTATGNLVGEDLLMGALSMGPAAMASVFKYTSAGSKLSESLKAPIQKIYGILGKERYAKKLEESFKGIKNQVKRSDLMQEFDGIVDDITLVKISGNKLDKDFFKKVSGVPAKKEIALRARKIRIKLDTSNVGVLGRTQTEYVKEVMDSFSSAHDSVDKLLAKGFSGQKVEKIALEDFSVTEKGRSGLVFGYFDGQGIIHINTNEYAIKEFINFHGGNVEGAAWYLTHHEMMHSVGRAHFDWEVKKAIGGEITTEKIYKEAHDLLTVRLMSNIGDNAKSQKYLAASEKVVAKKAESQILEKAAKNGLSSLNNQERQAFEYTLQNNKAYVAEWLTLSEGEKVAKGFLKELGNKAPEFRDLLKEIDKLHDIYLKIMEIV